MAAVSHGTTVATNTLLEGKVGSLGFITTEGYEQMLEIARQSVPDGYGNSYFWVKPPRIVPADRVRTVRGRLAVDGSEIRPFDEESAVAAARFFRDRAIATIGVCLLHSYANPDHERRMLEVLHREHPDATVSISSDVLREYREYERSITTLVDAAVKPHIQRYVATVKGRLDAFTTDENAATPRAVPFYVMKSNGGVLSAAEVVHQPITTVLSGPAAGALGAAVVAQRAGVSRVLTLDGGGTSTDVTVVIDGHPALTTEGRVGAFPTKIPMIDVVTVGAGGGSIAWISPEGTLKVGPQSAGADPGPLCYGRGGLEPTITDAHVLLGRIPPHLLGGEIPLDVAAAGEGVAHLAGTLGLGLEQCAAGILEISAWKAANALRQVTVQRGLDVRDFTLVTFGGSGPLLACRLVDVLGLAGVLVRHEPREPVGVRTAHRRRAQRRRPDGGQPSQRARPGGSAAGARRAGRRRRRRSGPRGLRRGRASLRANRRPALLRAGLRGARRGARRPGDPRAGRRGGRPLPRRAPRAVRLRLPRRRPAGGRVGQPPGHRGRAHPHARAP